MWDSCPGGTRRLVMIGRCPSRIYLGIFRRATPHGATARVYDAADDDDDDDDGDDDGEDDDGGSGDARRRSSRRCGERGAREQG